MNTIFETSFMRHQAKLFFGKSSRRFFAYCLHITRDAEAADKLFVATYVEILKEEAHKSFLFPTRAFGSRPDAMLIAQEKVRMLHRLYFVGDSKPDCRDGILVDIAFQGQDPVSRLARLSHDHGATYAEIYKQIVHHHMAKPFDCPEIDRYIAEGPEGIRDRFECRLTPEVPLKRTT